MEGLQAVEELNIKPKFWKDLLTDEPFTRKDIIHIQDPLNLQACPSFYITIVDSLHLKLTAHFVLLLRAWPGRLQGGHSAHKRRRHASKNRLATAGEDL